MNKFIFYGITERTLSLAEGLLHARPECSIFFHSETSVLSVPSCFHHSIPTDATFFEDVDFVFIDQSLQQVKEHIQTLRKYLNENACVIELQAVKSGLYQFLEKELSSICSVAGTYSFGDFLPGIVRGNLFSDRITALVCDNKTHTLEKLRSFWDLVGAKIVPTSAEFFDEITANTLSATQILASMYVHILQRDSWADTLFFGFYDRSLRRATEGISKNPIIDAEDMMHNKENISCFLSVLKKEIQLIEHLLAEDDKEKLIQYLGQAQDFQNRL